VESAGFRAGFLQYSALFLLFLYDMLTVVKNPHIELEKQTIYGRNASVVVPVLQAISLALEGKTSGCSRKCTLILFLSCYVCTN